MNIASRQRLAAAVGLAGLVGMPLLHDARAEDRIGIRVEVEIDGVEVDAAAAEVVELALEDMEIEEAGVPELAEEPGIPEPAVNAPPAPAGRAAGGVLGAGLRAIFDAIAPEPKQVKQPISLDESDDGEMPKDPRQAQLWQQRKQIRQQAKQMEQLFQPVLRTELEMVRQTCGSLPPDARREVLAVGRTAVQRAALDFATRQMQGGPGLRTPDARRTIQDQLAKAVEPHVPAGEFAAYQREQTARRGRRERAARVAIVTKLDRQLSLTETQRKAIQGDLERRWEASWVRELDDRGMIVNNHRVAPDYADACITPHLDPSQAEEWQRWRGAAGSSMIGMNVGWHFDGQGLQQDDDWWTK